MLVNTYNHEKEVREFFKKCQEESPEKTQEVFRKYPTLSTTKTRRIRKREDKVGLLGLQPSTLPIDVAFELGYDSVFLREGGEDS